MAFAMLAGVGVGLAEEGSPSFFSCEEEGCLLNIADRGWDPRRPDRSVGWCGEASIQMAALYYGAFFPQRIIHAAGNPAHPDLYGADIPAALDALGLFYSTYTNRPGDTNLPVFLEWIKEKIRRGFPVLVGMKIYPDSHPNWAYDHFVLAVGYTAEKFVFNTNIEGQLERSIERLSTREQGYAFANRFNDYFGVAITGFQRSRSEPRVFVSVPAETRREMEVKVTSIGLEPGTTVTLYRFCELAPRMSDQVSAYAACWGEAFVAEAACHTVFRRIDRDEIAIYRCLIASP